jgi:predicted metalloprotease
MLFRVFGIKGVVIGGLALGAFQLFGGSDLLGLSSDSGAAPAAGTNDAGKAFVSFVLDDAQRTWAALFSQRDARYRPARLVLFTDRVQSACGNAGAATGPFYCPGDQRVYIDLGFYRSLKERLGAPGDFAQAYVIAHEIGHHVSHLLDDLDRGRDTGDSGGAVRVELQADCYAGVWAHSAGQRDLLEIGDLDEALRAAAAIGDDTLQKQSSGVVRPESFTHGTSAQRVRWFKRGFEGGRPEVCDTFAAQAL